MLSTCPLDARVFVDICRKNGSARAAAKFDGRVSKSGYFIWDSREGVKEGARRFLWGASRYGQDYPR